MKVSKENLRGKREGGDGREVGETPQRRGKVLKEKLREGRREKRKDVPSMVLPQAASADSPKGESSTSKLNEGVVQTNAAGRHLVHDIIADGSAREGEREGGREG